MILFEPKKGAANKEAADLIAVVVKYGGIPIGMKALPRIRMFEEMTAVEPAQAMRIGRKVGRDPIQNHANVVLVKLINEVHEVLRRPIVGRRSEVSCRLISPRPEERMVHKGKEFDMREAQSLHVFDQFRCRFPIAQ